jgi:hypothetical protein
MAHYARINSENIVTYVTPIPNEMITDENGIEHEHRALAHLYATIPNSANDRWVQTSYNNNFRVRYAGLGYTYNESLDAFIPPKPYESWTLNEEIVNWEAPVQYPTDGNFYEWDEENLKWKLVD